MSSEPRSRSALELSALHIDTLCAALKPVKLERQASDNCQVELEGAEEVIAYAVSESDVATLRALERLVRDVIRANREAITKIADPPEPERFLWVAHQALDPVRLDGYRAGEYEVDFGPAALRFALSRRETDTLRRYHRLLLKIYETGANQEIIDDLVLRRSRTSSAP